MSNSRPERVSEGFLPITFQQCPARPTSATSVASAQTGSMKYDGYRVMVIREGNHVRLISRGGVAYARRFPWIVEAALTRPHRQFIIDGEAVRLALPRHFRFRRPALWQVR
jgi:ATP-dependent DNA ligase